MSIQQEIILRHKSSGHVRFQIPERLCSDEVASFVSDAINDFDGVYRVNLFRNKQKLAIRFVEENLPFQELVQQLLTLLSDLEKKGFFKAKPDAIKTSSFTNNLKLSNWKGTRWAKDKYTETKETAQAISILAKLGLKKKPEILANPEKTLITFFNDVLVLFLIKIHWKLISKKWILAPLKYRYQWLTIFYLMFLFIRSKTTKK
ncbi:hypothetical protein BPLS_P5973 [Bathymodiolus platifrons methanotrophic gill symbiont]|uniref:hypothetical protein n=1 Tax=Bathymodiolus platifrons methanotrophic gill symbiont TaxID=113268 RepID=UPI0011C99FED|nr:hypothetical protein [Bathymodiolus platifrons methanotrophic gill symbiont]MCK5869171.1 hypothetical protein [Methyloprofundus sp.]TXK97686.1 hypothetical protein BMR10_04510 [Methylococcaceae bacterium CS4]TXK99953.1 hypothetical protein BMR11_04870 [Methylococcaceae bacterium CS5]TXL06895.1 hypothetical protein BMR07_06020 [Methylococcaceae bacterium CS1]TXL07814.1 hypothetical protein BMR09_04605 [Methylococcaceae bacterium CS3]TXL10947.1 hypothetical protein BMR08_06660 [Methylococcac